MAEIRMDIGVIDIDVVLIPSPCFYDGYLFILITENLYHLIASRKSSLVKPIASNFSSNVFSLMGS